jgi:hypothetical protein
MDAPRVLILSASIGEGHDLPAMALRIPYEVVALGNLTSEPGMFLDEAEGLERSDLRRRT